MLLIQWMLSEQEHLWKHPRGNPLLDWPRRNQQCPRKRKKMTVGMLS
jgi:hypothetical protein